MDSQLAFRMVCRAVYILDSGSRGLVTPLDLPILLESVTIDHLFYRPRLLHPAMFHDMVVHHYRKLDVDPSFLHDHRMKWMIMVYEMLVTGELRLPIYRFPQ